MRKFFQRLKLCRFFELVNRREKQQNCRAKNDSVKQMMNGNTARVPEKKENKKIDIKSCKINEC